MRRLSRDAWLGIGLLVSLLALTFVAAFSEASEGNAPALASFSAQPNGAKALKLWLAELGYQVDETVLSRYEPPEEVSLIFILEPLFPITADEWDALDAWVEAGGTLVIAGDGSPMASIFRHYDFRLRFNPDQPKRLTMQSPLWLSPPPTDPIDIRSVNFLETDRDDFVAHLATTFRSETQIVPVVVSFDEGDGQVVLSAGTFPFSNLGLKQPGSPALMQNIARLGEQGGQVWFDEWHHGLQASASEIVGPGDWLRYTPTGRSLLYVALVIFVAIALRGKIFGRPVPLPKSTARRAPLEYITAIANLGRRAGHRRAVLDDYQRHLKRGLGHRYRLSPVLSDEEYVIRLADLNPNLDADDLRSLLTRLRKPSVSEGELVSIAADVADWLDR